MNQVAKHIIVSAALVSLLASTNHCIAGTPEQKAKAAIIVACASLQIADEHPLLPDSESSRVSHGTAGKILNSEAERSKHQLELTEASTNKLGHVRENDHASILVRSSIQPMRLEIINASIISEVLPAQLVIGSWERGCAACLRQERDIRSQLLPLNWVVGNNTSDQIQFTHVPLTQSVPQITLYQNGVEIKRWQGYQDPAMLSRELRRAWDNALQTVSRSTAGTGGVIRARAQIQLALAWWRRHVGSGRQAKFNWERTGAASFPLLAKSDWNAKSIFGEIGKMNFSVPGAPSLPVDALGFRYRIVGPDVEIDADPVTIAGLTTRLEPFSGLPNAGATPVQFIDPLTAWSIFSMLRDIWELLHPSCDLQLGKTVSASARLNDDTLIVDFNESPSIKLVALFTFHLQVKQIEITESSIKLIFGGSRLVKERTFQVQ